MTLPVGIVALVVVVWLFAAAVLVGLLILRDHIIKRRG